MIIKLSPLELKDFFLLKVECKFTAPKDGSDIREFFPNYVVDINFAKRSLPKNDNIVSIFMRIIINNDETKENLPGYHLLFEGVGVYDFEKIKEESERNSLMSSAVNMTLSYLRSDVANITGHLPFGKYLLPSIDMSTFTMPTASSTERSPRKRGKKRT